MNRFSYHRAVDLHDAVHRTTENPAARIIAGGTNLLDLMKYDVERPQTLVDINRVAMGDITDTSSGGVRIGALVSNSALAYDARIARDYPLLASAILAGASPQLRNVATTGGNILQRTRCYYFYDAAVACNKRNPGSGCPAIQGQNRIHAILGASASCIATHPSDMCVALAALEAIVHVESETGKREVAFADFHRLPGDSPEQDTTLRPGEVIVAVELPAPKYTTNYTYLKIRDRLSYAFALVSVAAGLVVEGGIVREARLALGGVAHKPWRKPEAEALLIGRPPSSDAFVVAASKLLEGARAQTHNGFKIELAQRTIVRALGQAAAGTPQSQTDKRIA